MGKMIQLYTEYSGVLTIIIVCDGDPKRKVILECRCAKWIGTDQDEQETSKGYEVFLAVGEKGKKERATGNVRAQYSISTWETTKSSMYLEHGGGEVYVCACTCVSVCECEYRGHGCDSESS